jgi:hypothetical protein
MVESTLGTDILVSLDGDDPKIPTSESGLKNHGPALCIGDQSVTYYMWVSWRREMVDKSV